MRELCLMSFNYSCCTSLWSVVAVFTNKSWTGLRLEVCLDPFTLVARVNVISLILVPLFGLLWHENEALL